MFQGSQIPEQFRAEQRMDQLMGRLDSLDGDTGINSAIPSITDAHGVEQNPKSFKAMVSIMQAQMMSEAFSNDNDDKNKDSDILSMMNMQNPAMAAALQGQMGMGQQMGMMNSNPMLQMMSAQNPAMAALMTGQINGSANPYAQNFFPQAQGTQLANFLKGIDNSSNLIMPVKGKVSSEYGHRHHPIGGHDHFHSGIDIAAKKGTVIRAPWEGKVVHVGYVQGFGANTVIVAHENQIQAGGKIVYSVFGHNDKALVQKGDKVRAGEIFATVGSEGNSTGPHLHWETRIANPGITGTDIFKREISTTIDPLSFA